MSTTTAPAPHLAPTACHICGGDPHDLGGHAYWSNADAERVLGAEPATTRDQAAAYVAEHRPY